uniref:Receptor kinase-like protein Xa21 n=1 Tax=Leersia perrieri TaxID=77586 RepID=A0A0D9XTA8_9ORYZ
MAASLSLALSLLLCLLLCPESSDAAAIHKGDELALLSFKSMLSGSDGSLQLASTWKNGSYCSWPGVVCGRRNRVVMLQLQLSNLMGRISPSLGNLSFLRVLNLSKNYLAGEIPPELGRLTRLWYLNLRSNSLQGVIPAAIGGCTNLTSLNLSDNMLQGMIPHEIGTKLKNLVTLYIWSNNLSGTIPGSLATLPRIAVLSMGANRLSGEIPPALGNLSSLQVLNLYLNRLSGSIPLSLGHLPSLSWLNLEDNKLTGEIPTSIWNISSLTLLSVRANMLSGMIPPNAFNTLPHLQKLSLTDNGFQGSIPASLANASGLSVLSLDSNMFSGLVPPEIGRLRNLTTLLLSYNLLETEGPKDWDFITALTNCSRLLILDLANNKFTGALPGSFSNLSSSLINVVLGSNKITGSIPKDIGNLLGLQRLDISNNAFTGSLPSSLGRLKNMVDLIMNTNKISGSIPMSIGNLTELDYFNLGMNTISGRITSTIGNLTKLSKLILSDNNFTGPIPKGLFNIQTLSALFDVSRNNLDGSIPREIGHLKNLVEFHAESNKLSGEIPSTLGECQLLQYLHLQNNFLIGSIPSALVQLKGLEALDLSRSNLSGQIPKSLGNITMLNSLNLSFNSFVGEMPTIGVFANASRISIQGNAKLCGGITDLHLPPCNPLILNKKHKFLVVPTAVSLVAALAILSSLCMLLTWHKRSKEGTPLTTAMKGHLLVSYSQLVKATDAFSPTNLLGSGSFGSVYRGKLDSQHGESTSLVAVKVLKLETPKALKSFTAECEALRNMRHRNLVKIVTVCSSIDNRGNDFKAIVYDFMPNGSLEDWLHPDTNNQDEQLHLNLHHRVTILLDVACALDYLHCHGPAPVVHCDVKSSNVLLDADMVAHVGDFGLARILVEGSSLMQQSTSSMGFRGTIGYAAPEYGVGNTASTHGDIYSYGILVLEILTGKRPTDSTFRLGLSLRHYVEQGLHGRLMDLVDRKLVLDSENWLQTPDVSPCKEITECLVALLRLGLSCSQELSSSRMQTGDSMVLEIWYQQMEIFTASIVGNNKWEEAYWYLTGNDATYKRKVECIVLLLELGMSCFLNLECPALRNYHQADRRLELSSRNPCQVNTECDYGSQSSIVHKPLDLQCMVNPNLCGMIV